MRDRSSKVLVAWINGILVENGWTVEELAGKAGLAPVALQRFVEKEDWFKPTISTVQKLATAAGSKIPPHVIEAVSEMHS